MRVWGAARGDACYSGPVGSRHEDARLNGVFGRIMKLPEVQEHYASLGVFTEHSTPREVTERIKSDLQEFAKILKAAGVEAE